MDDVEAKTREEREARYKSITSSPTFVSLLKTYRLYHQDNGQLKLHVDESASSPTYYGILKIYWGTQKVIMLKQEELSWKRRSMRVTDGVLPLSGHNRKQRPSLFQRTELSQDGNGNRTSVFDQNGDNNEHSAEKELSLDAEAKAVLQRQNKLKRRTMSFSGHCYNTNTAVFRPKYGTVSNVRVSSKQTTMEVIELLLTKFAVENQPKEFNLFTVKHSGEQLEFKITDFPLLKRIQMSPDENVAKIFIMERITEEISPEVAQYLNMGIPILEAILRKYEEEEEKEKEKIKSRFRIYKGTLQKKLAKLPIPRILTTAAAQTEESSKK